MILIIDRRKYEILNRPKCIKIVKCSINPLGNILYTLKIDGLKVASSFNENKILNLMYKINNALRYEDKKMYINTEKELQKL